MEIRKAVSGDMPELLRVYAAARETMKLSGNPTQWGDNRPSPAVLEEDIRRGNLYLGEEGGRVVGAFALVIGVEDSYEKIQGKWLNDEPYGVIHRVAGDGTARGLLGRFLDFCGTMTDNLKIDTHRDNRVMRHLLEKYGFLRCGTILAEDGSPRIAYQRAAKKGETSTPPPSPPPSAGLFR